MPMRLTIFLQELAEEMPLLNFTITKLETCWSESVKTGHKIKNSKVRREN